MAEDTITTVSRAPSKSYDAFISYSHAADDKFAPLLQKALQRFAKSWRQRRALEVFRDQTGLSVDPDLWHVIARALDSAEWFIYLASPDASRSEWVGKEINRWKEHKDRRRILVVLTDGVWAWDPERVDFDLERSTAIHPELQGVFPSEPFVLDMRWAHQVERLTLRDARFRDAVATIAAPLHGRPKDDLEDEDTRYQRHVRRLSRAALALMAVLLVAALIAGVLAVQQRNEARRQLLVAQARQLAATSESLLDDNLDQAQLLAAQAYAMHADEQTRGALYRAVTASPHLVRYYEAGSTVTALRGSADGNVIVAGLDDGRVLAWDSGHSGKPRQVTRLDDAITDVALTHDGGVIVASDGEELYRSDGGRTPDRPDRFVVDTLAISPTGRWLVVHQRDESDSGSRTMMVRADGTQTVPLLDTGENAGWDELTFSDEDRVVFFSGGSGAWKAVRLEPVPYVESEGRAGFGVHNYASAMARDGGFFTYTNSAPEVPVWATRPEVEFDRNERVGESIGRFPRAMALSADGGKLAVADGGTIYVSKTHARGTSGSPPVELTGNAEISEDGLEFLGSGDQLVSATGSKVTLWDTRQLSRISTSYSAQVPFGCVACPGPRVGLHPDGRRVALTSSSGDFELVVQALGRLRPMLEKRAEFPAAWGPPVWREAGAELVVPVSGRDQIQVLDLHRRGKVIAEWPLGLGESDVVADGLSRGGHQLVLLGSGGEVQVRNARTGRVTSKLSVSVPKAEGFDAPLLVLDHDLSEVAVVSGKTVRLTAIKSHEERTLRLGALDQVAIAGDRLAALTSSRRLRVWDTATGERIWSDSGTGGYLAGPVPELQRQHGRRATARRRRHHHRCGQW